MTKSCTHTSYMLSPVFIGPRFEKKHVRFSTTLNLVMQSLWLPRWFPLFFSCKEREAEVSATFDCMQYLYPAPTGWDVEIKVMDLSLNKTFDSYCVEQGKAIVLYERPERNPGEYQDILTDMCEGYVIVHAYKNLCKKPEFDSRPIPYQTMKEQYDSQCSASVYRNKLKPSFCSAEYKFQYEHQCRYYSLDCTDNILKEAVSDQNCDVSVRPDYKLHKSSYSDHKQLAKFAVLSYQNEIKFTPSDDWTYIEISSGNSWGFVGHAFINHVLKSIAVVFRGTDDKFVDWLGSNICFAPPGCVPAQYSIALKYFDSIRSNHGDSYEYIVTGHSLGGGLAQLIAIARSIRAVTFDAPGVFHAAKKLFNFHTINASLPLITSYIFGLNLVNCAGTHIVDPIQVTEKIIEDCDKFFVTYTLAQHGMDKGAENFDTVNGRPFYSQILNKDNLGILYAKRQFSTQCIKEMSAIQEEVFECAQILFATQETSSNQDKIMVFSDLIKIKKTLPILTEASKCGIAGTEKIEQSDAQKFLNHLKTLAVDQAIYDMPMPLNGDQYVTQWEQQECYNEILDICELIITITLHDDVEHFRKQIFRNEDLRQKYHVIDAVLSPSDICLAGTQLTDNDES